MKKIFNLIISIFAFVFIFCVNVFANYSVNTSYADDYQVGSDYTRTNTSYNLSGYEYTCSPEIKKIKFRQDDDYYYFDYDVVYKNTGATWNTSTSIGTYKSQSSTGGVSANYSLYQSVNFGASMFLSQTTGEHKYSYSSNVYHKNQFSSYGRLDGSQTRWIDQNSYSSSLTINGLQAGTSKTYNYDKTYVRINQDETIYDKSGSNLGTTYAANFTNYQLCETNITAPVSAHASIINASSQRADLSANYWTIETKGTAKIEKAYIEQYRYLQMYAPQTIKTYHNYSNILTDSNRTVWYSTTRTENQSWNSARGTAIDLFQYAYCGSYYDCELDPPFHQGSDAEHEWHILYANNRDTHNVKCEKCEWNKVENHNFEYEYDGLLNNTCLCGANDKVKFVFDINDDFNPNIITDIIQSLSSYTKHLFQEKVGHTFKWYEKYEKHFVNPTNPTFSTTNTEIEDVYIATCSVMTDLSDNFSTRYKAIYEPFKYTFHFSSDNNLGIDLGGVLPDQTFTYGEPQNLQDHIHVDGLKFNGWTLTPSSITKDFDKNQEIYNYTNVNNAEYTLYPIYTKLNITITYKTGDGYYESSGERVSEITKYYTYEDISGLLYPSGRSPETYAVGYLSNIIDAAGSNMQFDNMASLKAVMGERELENVVLVFVWTSPQYAHAEHGAGGNSPSGAGGGRDKSTQNKSALEENIEPINPENLYVFKNTSLNDIKDDIEIFSMNLTDKFFEKWGLKIDKNKNYGKTSHKYLFTAALPFAKYIDVIKNHPVISIVLFLLAYLIILICEKKCHNIIFGKKDKDKDEEK